MLTPCCRQLTYSEVYDKLYRMHVNGGWIGKQALTNSGRDEFGRTMKGVGVGKAKQVELREVERKTSLLRQQRNWWADDNASLVKIPWSGRESQVLMSMLY